MSSKKKESYEDIKIAKVDNGYIFHNNMAIAIICSVITAFFLTARFDIIKYIDFKNLDIISKTTQTLVIVISIAVWILITIIFGIHQNKVKNNNISIYDILNKNKEDDDKKSYILDDRLAEIYKKIAVWACLITGSILIPRVACIAVLVLALIIMIILEILKSFDKVDLVYTMYFALIIGFILNTII